MIQVDLHLFGQDVLDVILLRIDTLRIQFLLVPAVDVTLQQGYHGRADEPWFYRENSLGTLGVHLRKVRRLRPGADERHLPLQYVEQLGQLVQLGPPEESADGRDPGVVLRTDALVDRGRSLHHRAEFVHGEERHVLSDTFRREKDRSLGIQLHKNRNDKAKRRRDKKAD